MVSIHRIYTAARAEISHQVRARRSYFVGANVIFPTIIAVWVAFNRQIIEVNSGLFWSMLGVFIVLHILVIVISALGISSVLEVYFYSREISDKNISLIREGDLKDSRISYLSHLQNTCIAWRIMQRGYSSYKIDTKEKLYEAINELLFIVVDSRDLFFSFRGDEKWNFAVYLFHEQSGLLKPVWRNKHQRHPSRGNGRHWRPGQGHVGAAYANGQTVITQDSTAEDVANLLKIDENSSEPYDKTAYRSYVSVPIGPIGDTELPMGVLVATSNEPSRFNLYNALVLRHAAGELANLIYLNKIDFSIMFIDDVVEPEVPDK